MARTYAGKIGLRMCELPEGEGTAGCVPGGVRDRMVAANPSRMSKHVRINSLEELRAWNESPTLLDPPIVMDWFFPWFFEELLDSGKILFAVEVLGDLVTFTMLCERMDREQAIKRCRENLSYYAGHAARWTKRLRQVFLLKGWTGESNGLD